MRRRWVLAALGAALLAGPPLSPAASNPTEPSVTIEEGRFTAFIRDVGV